MLLPWVVARMGGPAGGSGVGPGRRAGW